MSGRHDGEPLRGRSSGVRRWLLLAGLATVAGLAIAAQPLSRRTTPEQPRPSMSAVSETFGPSDPAAASAARACDSAERTLDLIAADASARQVLTELDAGRAAARAAADRDSGVWRPLAGAMDALALALRRDDAQAADVAVRALLTACPQIQETP